jgi:hypothetical protein
MVVERRASRLPRHALLPAAPRAGARAARWRPSARGRKEGSAASWPPFLTSTRLALPFRSSSFLPRSDQVARTCQLVRDRLPGWCFYSKSELTPLLHLWRCLSPASPADVALPPPALALIGSRPSPVCLVSRLIVVGRLVVRSGVVAPAPLVPQLPSDLCCLATAAASPGLLDLAVASDDTRSGPPRLPNHALEVDQASAQVAPA